MIRKHPSGARHTQDDCSAAEVDEVERGLQETQRTALEDAHDVRSSEIYEEMWYTKRRTR